MRATPIDPAAPRPTTDPGHKDTGGGRVPLTSPGGATASDCEQPRPNARKTGPVRATPIDPAAPRPTTDPGHKDTGGGRVPVTSPGGATA